MKTIKHFSALALGSLFLLANSTLTSCQADESSTPGGDIDQSLVFLSKFENSLGRFKSADVVARPASRAEQGEGDGWVYFDDMHLNLKDHDDLNNARTIQDLMDIVKNTGIHFDTVNDGDYNDSIQISEAECALALQQSLQKSRDFLYAHGFTELEVNQMLIENNAHETTLIPLATLIAEEEHNNSLMAYNSSFDPFSVFAFEAKAAVTLEQVAHCAKEAIVGDFIALLGNNLIITKTAIKAACKIVAKRINGPIAAAIFVIEFSDCMGWI